MERADAGAHFDGDQSGTVNGVTPPAVQHLTAEVTADSGEYQVLARWDTPKVVKGVSFMLRLTVAADDGSERLVSTARTTETTYRFMYWIAASINIKPGHDYYFYIRSVNTVGKSAFVEAVGQPSDDASGYLNFFKGEIGKTHLAQELWTQIDNGQLAPDLAEIRTSITGVSNEITQTVNKKLEDQSAAIQQIQKVQVDTNNNLNSMWAEAAADAGRTPLYRGYWCRC